MTTDEVTAICAELGWRGPADMARELSAWSGRRVARQNMRAYCLPADHPQHRGVSAGLAAFLRLRLALHRAGRALPKPPI